MAAVQPTAELETGLIAGLVIGVVVMLSLGIVIFLYHKRKTKYSPVPPKDPEDKASNAAVTLNSVHKRTYTYIGFLRSLISRLRQSFRWFSFYIIHYVTMYINHRDRYENGTSEVLIWTRRQSTALREGEGGCKRGGSKTCARRAL